MLGANPNLSNLLRGGKGNHKGTRKAYLVKANSILGTVRILQANLCAVRFRAGAISTTKIKHCYGFIAGALSIVGKAICHAQKRNPAFVYKSLPALCGVYHQW